MQDEVVAIALGSNLGDRLAHLQFAVDALAQHQGIYGIEVSPVYEAAAHTLEPDTPAPAYLNATLLARTTLPAETILDLLLDLEHMAGRIRQPAQRWAPRTLDLDLLRYGKRTIQTPTLTVPHPRMGARRFVLCPLADQAPHLYIPMPFDAEVGTLLRRCQDEAPLRRRPDLLLTAH